MKIESSKPRKQRKFRYNMRLHEKRNLLAGHLEKSLAKKTGRRSISLRKGDTVKVMRGKYKGTQGKITGVDYKLGTVFIEKISRKKSDGTETPVGIRSSKLLVTDLETNDSKRLGKKSKEKKEKKGE